MTLSLNDRALELADRLAGDAEALGVGVTTLSNGTRVRSLSGIRVSKPAAAFIRIPGTSGRSPAGIGRRPGG